ncbi:hypothetical protein GCM10023187_50180 [Nibrella viscosa]|uniref:Uncharacterized protein n=1 Tax=Nibrella viscosa TaxID=1084524 RepID=A0ABP8KW77_9BACT
MNMFRSFLVLAVFSISTYVALNWLLDISWNWVLIGRITIAVFAIISSVVIGSMIAHGLLSLMQRITFNRGIFGH